MASQAIHPDNTPKPRWKAWQDANITCEGVQGHIAECSSAERAREIVNALNGHDELVEAIGDALDRIPCECAHSKRERGEHMSGCWLFDLQAAHNRATQPTPTPGQVRVDKPDGTYGADLKLPGDPPGPCDVRRVINGYVWWCEPRTGRLFPIMARTTGSAP